METKIYNITCIQCPIGCALTVEAKNGNVIRVEGNSCPRGDIYGRAEVTHPVRTLTTTVNVRNGNAPLVPVKTKSPVPKELISDCMQEIKKLCAEAPVHTGDILLENVCGTGVQIVSTKNVDRFPA